MRLKDRVAIVTGAGSGIGFATALRFVEEGATVVAADLVHTDQLAEAIGSAGGALSSMPTDVSQSASVDSLFSSTLERYGCIDVLINNAGIEVARTATDTTEDEWDRLMSVNLKAFSSVRKPRRWLCGHAAG